MTDTEKGAKKWGYYNKLIFSICSLSCFLSSSVIYIVCDITFFMSNTLGYCFKHNTICNKHACMSMSHIMWCNDFSHFFDRFSLRYLRYASYLNGFPLLSKKK